MCGKGQPVDDGYIPRMPVDPDTNIPTREMDEEERLLLHQKICNAFYGIAAESLEADIGAILHKFLMGIGRSPGK